MLSFNNLSLIENSVFLLSPHPPTCVGLRPPPPPPPQMAPQSNTDLRLLNGFIPIDSVSWPSLSAVFNSAFINIGLYTVQPSFVWSSFLSTSLRIFVKYLTYFPFTIHSIVTGDPWFETRSQICSA
jgi:hypothetical protein